VIVGFEFHVKGKDVRGRWGGLKRGILASSFLSKKKKKFGMV